MMLGKSKRERRYGFQHEVHDAADEPAPPAGKLTPNVAFRKLQLPHEFVAQRNGAAISNHRPKRCLASSNDMRGEARAWVNLAV